MKRVLEEFDLYFKSSNSVTIDRILLESGTWLKKTDWEIIRNRLKQIEERKVRNNLWD